VTVPPVIAVTVPIAMPIARTTAEDVFLPVTAKMIVCVPEIVSIPELGSGISLVPHACGAWISIIRKSRETISLIRLSDRCRSVRTRTGKRHPISINRRLTKLIRPVRTHSKRRVALAGIIRATAKSSRGHWTER